MRTLTARRHVLLVAPLFPPWGGGGVMRALKLAKYLPTLGWQLTVLCSDEAKPEQRDDRLLGEVPASVRVVRVRGPFWAFGRPIGQAGIAWREGRNSRFIGMFKSIARAVLIPDRWIGWALKAGRLAPSRLGHPTVVISTGPPHSSHLVGRALARRAGVPFVVDLRDDWGANPMHASPAPWHEPLDRAFEGRTLRAANRIVSISAASAARLTHRRPELADRVVVIPNGFDPDDLAPLPRRVAASPETVSFLYAGSLRDVQDVGQFFEVFGRKAAEEPTRLTLRFLGRIDPGQAARARAAMSPELVTFEPPVSHSAALRAMAGADVLIAFTGGGGAGPDTMTGKIYEYLALRRPILLIGPPGPAARLVDSAGAGAVAAPYDPNAIETAIKTVIRQAQDASFLGASDVELSSFDRASHAAQWSQLLETLHLPG